MLFLPQEANIQSKLSSKTKPNQKDWQKLSFPNPCNENPNQEHKTLQNIIWGSKLMKRVHKYLRDVNGMKNHSNWLGFDVKIMKEGLKRG